MFFVSAVFVKFQKKIPSLDWGFKKRDRDSCSSPRQVYLFLRLGLLPLRLTLLQLASGSFVDDEKLTA